MRLCPFVLTLAVALAACAPSRGDDAPGGLAADASVLADAGPPPFVDATPVLADGAPTPSFAAVYAHSAEALYRVDPDTLRVSEVAPFGFAGDIDRITDIAIDKAGNMVGISNTTLYAIDDATGACTYVADLDGFFNGLTYVPATGGEQLIAVAYDGSVFRLDPVTGASTRVGAYGEGIESSGDIVAVVGFGIVATVELPGEATDFLARIDPVTFEATVIGDTGVENLFGLGFWGDRVYGFSSRQRFVTIDVATGIAETIESGDVSWWGAGVTTLAPVID